MTSIAGVDIGNGNPCRIVAEMSNAHNGSLERALRIIEAVAEAGADFVKFQCYTPDELVQLRGDGPAPDPWGAEGWSMRDLYEKAQTPHEWFPELVSRCRDIGLPWFASVFGYESFELLDSLGCPAYKISALDFDTYFACGVYRNTHTHHIPTWKYQPRPVVVSTRSGMSYGDVTLNCPAGYPQDPEMIDYPGITFGWTDGLSYHGTDVDLPIKAVLCDAKMVEVHVQLDDEPSELEANVSLNMTDLAKLCRSVKAVPHA